MKFNLIDFPWDAYHSQLAVIDNIKLTPKEIDVVACLINSKNTKSMAPILSITANTVDTHIQNITRKLETSSRGNIINFVEKSDQFSIFNDHYIAILNKHLFEHNLADFAKLHQDLQYKCILLHGKIGECQNIFIQQIAKHLNMAGTNVSIHNWSYDHESNIIIKGSIPADSIVFTVLSDDIIQELKGNIDGEGQQSIKKLQNELQLYDKNMLLNFHADLEENISKTFKDFDFIHCHNQQNYYILMKKIIEKIFFNQEVNLLTSGLIGEVYTSDQGYVFRESSFPLAVNKFDWLPSITRNKPNLSIVVTLFAFIIFCVWYMIVAHHDAQKGINNLPYPNQNFIGRQELLAQIHNYFIKYDEKIVAIVGGPGFGKTQLAKRYAFNHRKDYDLCWWIDSKQDLYNQYKQLSVAVNGLLPVNNHINPINFSKESLILKIKEIIINYHLKILLIFDNVSCFSNIKEFIPYSSKNLVEILMTSRNHEIWKQNVEINKFERQESLRFICNHLIHVSHEDADRLANILDDYPLQLAIAISSIKNFPQYDVNEYIKVYQRDITISEDQNENTVHPSIILDGYSQDVRKSLKISLDHLAQNYPKTLKLIYFLSMFSSKNIPHNYIKQWVTFYHKQDKASDIVQPLIDQSLVDIVANEKADSIHSYYLHDLIIKVIRTLVPLQDQSRIMNQAIQVILSILPRRTDLLIEEMLNNPIHLQHTEKMIMVADQFNYVSKDLLKLKIMLFGYYLWGSHDIHKAKLMLEELEHVIKSNKIVLNLYYQASFLFHKSFFESDYNFDYKKAVDLALQALDLLKSQKGFNEEKLLITINIARWFTIRGLNDDAEFWLSEGQKLMQLSNSHAYNAYYYYAKINHLINKNMSKAGLELVESIKNNFDQIKNFPTIQYSLMHREVELLIKSNRFEDAKIYNDLLYKK